MSKSAVILSSILLLFAGSAFAANGTTVGAITLTQTLESIGYSCAFTDDDNTDMTATVEWRVSGGDWATVASPSTTPPAYIDRRAQVRSGGSLTANPYTKTVRGSIVELSRATTYEVRVTFTDADGVSGTNPVSDSVTTWGHDQPTIGSTCDASVTNDSELSSALSNCAGSTGTITLANGNYSGVSISSGGSSISAYVKLVAASPQGAHFTSEVTLNGGDYVQLSDLDFDAGILVQNGSTYCIIGDNTLTGQGIRLDDDVTGLLIDGNSFESTDTNSGDQYDSAIYFKTAMTGGGVIRNNSINIAHDGVGGETNSTIAAGCDNWDVYDNEITRADDDFLEIEGGSVNTRVWGNTLHIRGNTGYNRGNGLAINPCVVGPLYLFKNLIHHARHGMKVGNTGGGGTTDGTVYILNNTFADIDENGINRTDSAQENLYFKNNIFNGIGTQYILEEGDTDYGWTFDYNSWYDTGSPKWEYYNIDTSTWATWHAAYDLNGINVDPSLDANYKPDAADDPVVGAGQAIDFFSTDKDGVTRVVPWDIGAYEYDSSGGTTTQFKGIGSSGCSSN